MSPAATPLPPLIRIPLTLIAGLILALVLVLLAIALTTLLYLPLIPILEWLTRTGWLPPLGLGIIAWFLLLALAVMLVAPYLTHRLWRRRWGHSYSKWSRWLSMRGTANTACIALFFTLIAMVLNIAVWEPPRLRIEFSEFMAHVEKRQVARVAIKGRVIKGVLHDGTLFQTSAPDDRDLLHTLRQRGVKIEGLGPPNPSGGS